MVANIEGRSIEVQIRTELQQRWAEVSEKYSDVIDPAIKYGGGDPKCQDALLRASADVAEVEYIESEVGRFFYLNEDLDEEQDLEKYKARVIVGLDALVKQLNDRERRKGNR